MRITFMTAADDLSGGVRVIATYARCLQNRGHEVLVVSNAPDPFNFRDQLRALRQGSWRKQRDQMRAKASAGHIALSGVPHHILSSSRPITARDLPDADILIATWWETAVWMQGMPVSKGRKVHLIQGYEIWHGDSVRERVHATLRLPNRKIAISSGLKRDIEAELGDLGIVVVPNAVDLVQFNAPVRDRHVPPTVGFIYSQLVIKGADICIQACEQARRSLPDLQVLAFGTDHPSPELPLPANAIFVYRPAQDTIAQLYARCDAWLFGSRLDSFGLPILEAMACRTPVIGVPIGAAPELLADGAGILVASESSEGMSAAILRLCAEDAEYWRRTSDLAYTRAHGYSWEDATTRLLKYIEAT